jgi:hypothetical protein
LADFGPEIDFEAQQFVGAFYALRGFDLGYAQLDFCEIVDADFAVGDCGGGLGRSAR